MLYGIIDIGSNTIRLAVYDIQGETLKLLAKRKHQAGLAAHIADGRISQAGVDKTVEILREFRAFLEIMRIDRTAAFATAALRNVVNSAEAVQEIGERSGVPLRIISGDEEADFAFVAIAHDLAAETGLAADIGGASTELIFFRERSVVMKASLPLGSLAMRVKYVGDVLPTSQECAAMERAVMAELDRLHWPEFKAPKLCGIGGTFKGATALYNAFYAQDETNRLMRVDWLERLRCHYQKDGNYSQEEAVLLLTAAQDRVHTLVPGLTIAGTIMRRFGCEEVFYSDSGVREGFIRRQIMASSESMLR